MDKEIVCTLGPASLRGREIRRLTELGVSLFRINLSHTSLGALSGTIATIREHTGVPICLDTEGAQIRTGRMASGAIVVRDQALLHVSAEPIVGGATELSFHPAGVIEHLDLGSLISIDFNTVLAQVVERRPDRLTLRVLNGGEIGQNKAVTVLGQQVPMPPMTHKDVEALRLGAQLGIRHVALSFANRASDVDEVRQVSAPGATVISKIECRGGMQNLREIAARSDALLIDRGDLSREVSIEQIPGLQKAIIHTARSLDRKVYVATNLLESMVSSPTPTRAEVNDIYNTLLDGADGLVLAAETAIGQYPIGCASMVRRLILEFQRNRRPTTAAAAAPTDPMLTEPHGGRLVQRVATAVDPGAIASAVAVDESVLLDCEQIALGTYSPLTGFMDRESLQGVLHDSRLPSGLTWTMPIVLQVPAERAALIRPGERIGLLQGDGAVHSVLDVTEVYRVDLDQVAAHWFGTTSASHPGVARLLEGGPWLVAGDVTLIRARDFGSRRFELSPGQARAIFASKGWSKVVGFRTRNVILRVHEHVQLSALDTSGADGLFVSAVVGPSEQCGDWSADAVVRSYQLMMEGGFYPRGRVVLGAFPSYQRFCGPREWAFAALCGKNMGCSHFVVGREHRGLNGFHEAEGRRAFFARLGDLGIVPIFFDALGWDAQDKRFRPPHGGDGDVAQTISGTQVREQLRDGVLMPEWFLRPEIQDLLRAEISAGRPVFAH
jgi:pyruvate kinase